MTFIRSLLCAVFFFKQCTWIILLISTSLIILALLLPASFYCWEVKYSQKTCLSSVSDHTQGLNSNKSKLSDCIAWPLHTRLYCCWSTPWICETLHACVLSCFSCVWLFVTLLTYSLPGPFDPEILQARILEWVAMPSSRGFSWPRDRTHISYVSCIDGQVVVVVVVFYH